MTQPELVKRLWRFFPRWTGSTWAVEVSKAVWGLSKCVYSVDWDEAHRIAVKWASEEERVINGPDTIPAPPMSEDAAHAAE